MNLSSNEKEPPQKVVFRVYRQGEVIALLPELPGDAAPDSCVSYLHVGQHGSADYEFVISITSPATEKQYRSLKAEMEALGYSLLPVKMCTKKMRELRTQNLFKSKTAQVSTEH